ncbi:hypothetical protein F5884DRAFT_717530 [Xylogone sp. PMI_703]|nr:hypothetical protein F5884DRAFT_717530 [Xylogone sp. PMI_703]
MSLEPIGDYHQVQRLTTALKNICRDYPAGGTVLRELLQNADDAGATAVKFVLDDNTYPTDPLIDPDLAQYQGPALLAYNDAQFRDEDFLNLSNIGDSIKLEDGLTTGKFGRGFNSVYNWTDSPSIISRDRLLILDPHFSWSKGGPAYNFVKSAEDPRIKNHMAAFNRVMDKSTCSLDGTVIRIPLRTSSQANKSEISNRETTVSEVRDVLDTFGAEFGNNGLLFMRNVEKLEIESAGGNALQIKLMSLDGLSIKPQRSLITDAVTATLKSNDRTFNHTFDAVMERKSVGKTERSVFAIHHTINNGSTSSSLSEWAKEQLLIPWVAISDNFQGSMYSILPLPIKTGQPVHIHGMFSISPDRARLYHLSDTGMQDKNPALWNQCLFNGPVIEAWAKLLEHISLLKDANVSFDQWPRNSLDERDPLNHAPENLIELVKGNSLRLFPTNVGYRSSCLIDTGDESVSLKEALERAEVPVTYLPEQYREILRYTFGDRILSPTTLCNYISGWDDRIQKWSAAIKQKLLEYLTSDPEWWDYDDIALFPFEDGSYRSIKDYSAYIHQYDIERDLFRLEAEHNIDLDRISELTMRSLRLRCGNPPERSSLCFRSVRSFRDYLLNTVFKTSPRHQDIVEIDEEASTFVLNAWKWIIKQQVNLLDDALVNLWLIPLDGRQFRKIEPGSSSRIIIADDGEAGNLVRKIFDTGVSSHIPLMRMGSDGFAPEAQILLRDTAKHHPDLCIMDVANQCHLAEWLNQNADTVAVASDEEKELIVKLFSMDAQSSMDWEIIGNLLRPLKIFRRISYIEEETTSLTWVSLDDTKTSIGSTDGIQTPELDEIQILDAPWGSPDKTLLERTKVASCKNIVSIIEENIIPAWGTTSASKWSDSCKEQAARLVFDQYSNLGYKSKGKLRHLDIVPVSTTDEKVKPIFERPSKLVDYSNPELVGLFYPEETAFPISSFRKYRAVLIDCGLKTAVDEALINSRIRAYADSKHPPLETRRRVQLLVRSNPEFSWSSSYEDVQMVRQPKWLPVYDLSGNWVLKAPGECRGVKDLLLVNYLLPVFDIAISEQWETHLGWYNNVPSDMLLSQLRMGLQKQEQKVVNAVLAYIVEKQLLDEAVVAELTKMPCILTARGNFLLPSQVFSPSSDSLTIYDRLHPYLGTVDRSFYQKHISLLAKFDIKKDPTPNDLLSVQKILETKAPLSDADKAVAIEVLRLASCYSRNQIVGLKALTKDGEFCPIETVCYHHDDGQIQIPPDITLTHPDIPSTTIRRLGIETLSQQLIQGILEASDFDEEEFEQREQVTTRISDTLDRYHIEATFGEYLANADDAEASEISWLLDKREHSKKHLLTPELKKHQGPALLVHNNSVFSEDDFKGFRSVGEGSKRENKDTIGQFGRGAQTMYHWTDVPIILSGKFLIILDPQQEVLPKNRTSLIRKPGVKVLLSKLRDLCPDQLAPFNDLWDYTTDLNDYNGTIFRFPLRQEKTQSKLIATSRNIDIRKVCKLMDKYFDQARISLLFLRHIRSISFQVHGDEESRWHVSCEDPLDEASRSYSEWKMCSIIYHKYSGKDIWWLAIDGLQPKSHLIPQTSRRAMKQPQCGIAALIRTNSTNDSKSRLPEVLPPQLFSTLPLSIPSDLPVYLNGTFLLSGDRQSLVADEFGHQTISTWNQYILTDALPNLYLSFLEGIAKLKPEIVMNYWPQNDPPKRSSSEIICNSFWGKVPKSRLRLFPKAQLEASLVKQELLDITEATFDFLPKKESKTLAPVLLSQGVNLVRGLPDGIVEHLKSMAEVNSVSGSMIRGLFKTDASRVALQDHILDDPEVLKVLWKLAIPIERDLDELDTCCFLPLENGSLGSLRLLPSSAPTTTYYIATKREIELFNFASAVLVSADVKEIFQGVLSSKKFNLKVFELIDVKELLKYKPKQSLASEEGTKWLSQFWEYWNETARNLASVPLTDIDDFELYRATCNGVSRFVKRSYLDDKPSVVEPLPLSTDGQLCMKIPGLNIFDRALMPKSLREEEASLSYENSFLRFVRALVALAKQNRKSLGTFVEAYWDLDNLKVIISHALRELVNHYSNVIDDASSKNVFEFKEDLRSVPLWPSCLNPSSNLICANDAWLIQDPKLLVPWMKSGVKFVDFRFAKEHDKCMRTMGITTMQIEDLLDCIFPIPPSLSNADWEGYLALVSKLSELLQSHEQSHRIQQLLSQKNIVADGNRKFVKAEELYDHTDAIYLSALRNVATSSFLHLAIRRHRDFWVKIGLRHQENRLVNGKDYIWCLQEILKRLIKSDSDMDSYLEADCQSVLSPLVRDPGVCNFSLYQWEKISEMEVFLSQANNPMDPIYRQEAMAAVAVSQPRQCLSRIVFRRHAAVCWSQIPFPVHQPGEIVLGRIPNGGAPSIHIVWKHLQFLSQMAQNIGQEDVQDFLADLHKTYSHLQTHLTESKTYFLSYIGTKDLIWLNVNWKDRESVSLDDVRSSWCSLDNLVLSSSCDKGEMKAVRSGLMRNETLLKSLGCKSVVYPTVSPPSYHQGRSVSTSLRKLRKEGKLLDVTFIAEGRRISAHKVVLAAISEKFEHQFSGRWQNEDEIRCDDDDDPDEAISYHTLSTMVDYAYEDEVDWKEMEVQNGDDEGIKKKKLDMLFDLHKGANYWLIPELKSQVEHKILEAGREFLNIQTAHYMLERANEVGASVTAEMCAEFIRQNEEILRGANQ